jgi:hypothetical protein
MYTPSEPRKPTDSDFVLVTVDIVSLEIECFQSRMSLDEQPMLSRTVMIQAGNITLRYNLYFFGTCLCEHDRDPQIRLLIHHRSSLVIVLGTTRLIGTSVCASELRGQSTLGAIRSVRSSRRKSDACFVRFLFVLLLL